MHTSMLCRLSSGCEFQRPNVPIRDGILLRIPNRGNEPGERMQAFVERIWRLMQKLRERTWGYTLIPPCELRLVF
jgi:hypothetical protein